MSAFHRKEMAASRPETDKKIESDFLQLRNEMVDLQIESRGVKDRAVLYAMHEIPRHLFVPESSIHSAYEDCPLPIGSGQTISQPYIVALMTELLNVERNDTILELGSGSGYQAAVLSRIVKKVYSVERIPELLDKAKQVWKKLGYNNIEGFSCNGWDGLEDCAPFDGIIVTAAAAWLPEKLVQQLITGAKMVIPIGEWEQQLWVIEKTDDGYTKSPSIWVRFVPLIEE